MDRRDWYYRQLVTEGDLDEAFDLVEEAEQNYVLDTGLVGVYTGLEVAQANTPNLTVQVAAGTAYDQNGQRINIPSTQVVSLAEDSNGLSTEVTTPGFSRKIGLYVQFDRVLSNAKTDGNNQTVMYNRDEHFKFIVEMSDEAANPSLTPLKGDAILLADITRAAGQTTYEDANIDDGRREYAISVSAGDYSIKAGRVEDALEDVVTALDALGGATGAAAIGYAGGDAWADGTTNPATTVEGQLDKIVDDLAGPGGASKIGSTATGDVAATTVQDAIAELASEKGNKGTANTWTGVNTFSGALNVSGAAAFTGSAVSTSSSTHVYHYGDVTVQADGAAKTVTHKLHHSTDTGEVTRYFEVLATGTTGNHVLEEVPLNHVTRYEVDVLARDSNGYKCEKLIATAYRGAGAPSIFNAVTSVAEHSSTNGEWDGGTATLSISGNDIQVAFSASEPARMRFVVRAMSIKPL